MHRRERHYGFDFHDDLVFYQFNRDWMLAEHVQAALLQFVREYNLID